MGRNPPFVEEPEETPRLYTKDFQVSLSGDVRSQTKRQGHQVLGKGNETETEVHEVVRVRKDGTQPKKSFTVGTDLQKEK